LSPFCVYFFRSLPILGLALFLPDSLAFSTGHIFTLLFNVLRFFVPPRLLLAHFTVIESLSLLAQFRLPFSQARTQILLFPLSPVKSGKPKMNLYSAPGKGYQVKDRWLKRIDRYQRLS
jgi:hypothetical protein